MNPYVMKPYVDAFVGGGFTLVIVGILAPLGRRRLKKLVAVGITITGLVAVWCVGTALPPFYIYLFGILLI